MPTRAKGLATSDSATPTMPATSGPTRDQRAVWMPWNTGGCIATREKELAFVDQLRRFGDDPFAVHTRGDTTACLNALRSGLTVDLLLQQCPGLEPTRLAGAYDELERRRGRAERAWTTIVASGSISALAEHGDEAGALLPAVTARLVTAATTTPESFATTVLRFAQSVDTCRRTAWRLEYALARCTPRSTRARQLSALLYHPYGDSIATRDHFLPDRVGMLDPKRVSSLLGELDAEQSLDQPT